MNEIPAVSFLASTTLGDVDVIYPDGIHGILDKDEIPAFPIVVVKENERITPTSQSDKLRTTSLSSPYLRNSNTPLVFIDDAFNNTISKSEKQKNSIDMIGKSRTSADVIPNNLQKIYDAYDIFQIDGWQRDHIYYNLTKARNTGPFDKKYMEYIVGFEIMGDAKDALKKISDQDGDPRLNESKSGGGRNSGRGNGPGPSWTDGEFEFKVKVLLGSTSPIGTELVTFFRVKPDDLFETQYEGVKNGNTINVTTLYLKSVKAKYVQLDLPLMEWSLENYSSTIKIAIEEVDLSQTTKTSSSTTIEYAANFEYNPTWGEVAKKGLKFGANGKLSRTNAFETTTSHGNDVLGEVIINFEDPVIVNRNDVVVSGGTSSRPGSAPKVIRPNYNNKYQTGFYKIHIAPKKIY